MTSVTVVTRSALIRALDRAAQPRAVPVRARRFDVKPTVGRPLVLDRGHRAVREGRTLFPVRVEADAAANRLLVSGFNSKKIGATVAKGAWRGMPIFTLTLEERATCPRSCRHWHDCFGNKMQWARRVRTDRDLVPRLGGELAALQRAFPGGFVVRLHVLGDFFAIAYARRWLAWLRRFPALRVFGYTAWPASTALGRLLRAAGNRLWPRFAMRTSSNTLPTRAAETIAFGDEARPGSIVCPAQTGRTECCATCALCWATRRNIAFLRH